ncbi:MAG: T9SS type A sorting domain-containing protein [Saprospiraceae bacterium]
MNTKLIFILLFTLSIVVCQAQSDIVTYKKTSTKIQKLGQTKALIDLVPKSPTSRKKKQAIKSNTQAPDNFKNRGKSKVTRPEMEHQGPDPVRQKVMGTAKVGALKVNVDGLFNTFGSPHDPSGDIGLNYYIQAINSTQIGIFDKLGGLVMDFAANTLWTTLNKQGIGDPIILFDEMANRWLITEFAGPKDILIAVSDTDDPLGSYTVYDFTTPFFPDYPKFGIWPNAIVVTTNEGGPSMLDNYFIDRRALLASEDEVTMQHIEVIGASNTEAGFYVSTPLDFNGDLLPQDSLPVVMRINDSSWGATDEDALELYTFDIDWNDESNTQIINTTIVTTPFDSYPCSSITGGFACVPQLGGNGLDAIPEVILNVPQYRNFGTHESIVLSFLTDATDGLNQAGVRWMELRKSGDEEWSIYQEGTYAPDDKERYMSSIAIDKFGNIALGYNISSTTDYVGIGLTGRFANDPLGVMTVEEIIVVEGTTSISSGGRFGDYAQMGVDPTNGFTFWYTSEYAGNSDNNNTKTRIVAFKLQKSKIDARPSAIISPVTSGGLTAEESVTVQIFNAGIDSLVNTKIGLIFENQVVDSFIIVDTIFEGDSYDHTFIKNLDLSNFETYQIGVFTQYPNDEQISNDTIFKTVNHIPNIDGSVIVTIYDNVCSDDLDFSFFLKNNGIDIINVAEISISFNDNLPFVYEYTGNIARDEQELITIPINALIDGENEFNIEILSINNEIDQKIENNKDAVTVIYSSELIEYTMLLTTDDFPEEINWFLSNGPLIASGSGYDQVNTLYTNVFCLELDECYNFYIQDSAGDGICCDFGEGGYQIINQDGLVEVIGGEFGTSENFIFCVGQPCVLSTEVEVFNVTDENNPNGSIMILAVGGLEPYSYSIDNGVTTQNNPLFENLTAGTYNVLVTSADSNCTYSEEIVVMMPTSVIDIENSYSIIVSPNPGNGYYHIEVKNLNTNKYKMQMQIINSSGKIIQQMPLQKYNNVFEGQISLLAYPSGVYYIRFLNQEIKTMSRIVKL